MPVDNRARSAQWYGESDISDFIDKLRESVEATATDCGIQIEVMKLGESDGEYDDQRFVTIDMFVRRVYDA